ncbi:CBS domain-containing protein [Candidatus Woesearchaeota archaeon]|nr:CBS domain-containing protein [Candidatus Woesearchaeota archaeon]
MRTYFIRDIMTTTPVTIQVSETARTCAEIMASKEVGSLVVMNKQAFCGIVTEQDLVVKVVSSGISPDKILVKDIMTPSKDIISIEPGRSIYTAMVLMNNNDVRRLPVIEKGVLQGIVTMKDIFGIEPDLLDSMFEFLPDEHKSV